MKTKSTKTTIYIFTIIILIFITTEVSLSASFLSQKLSGKILLQVEGRGESWYVNPTDLSRYYMGRPKDAFNLMRSLGLGIKHKELLEYLNNGFPLRLAGRIMLDVENNGEAYYIYPEGLRGYYMGKPIDAFNVMRKFGLGVTNKNLNKISIGTLNTIKNNITTNSNSTNNKKEPSAINGEISVISLVANALMSDNANILNHFTPESRSIAQYTFNFLNTEGRFILGNIMAGAKLTSSTDTEKIYSTTIFYFGYTATLNFHVKKQEDGTWLLANL